MTKEIKKMLITRKIMYFCILLHYFEIYLTENQELLGHLQVLIVALEVLINPMRGLSFNLDD